MPKMRLLLAALLAAAAFPALAQAPQGAPMRIRGTIEAFEGRSLLVASRDGAKLTTTLAPKFAVLAVVKRRLADIKPGDFVGVTSLTGSDGRQHAVEAHILPTTLRSVVPEGRLPWDLMSNSLMTNATVARVTAAPKGHVLHVTVKGAAAELMMAPGTTIVGYVPGDASLLKPGAAIFVVAFKQPGGSSKAARVIAEKNGVKPPL
ncbi:MAG TPA: hypothetical protein VGR91_11285 [Stellaceae bacterium]|nr:hypothetical protein [Stellaceae bacterium]